MESPSARDETDTNCKCNHDGGPNRGRADNVIHGEYSPSGAESFLTQIVVMCVVENHISTAPIAHARATS